MKINNLADNNLNPSSLEEMVYYAVVHDKNYSQFRTLPDGTEYYLMDLGNNKCIYAYLNRKLNEFEISSEPIEDIDIMRYFKEIEIKQSGTITINLNSEDLEYDLSLLSNTALSQFNLNLYISNMKNRYINKHNIKINEVPQTKDQFIDSIIEEIRRSIEFDKELSTSESETICDVNLLKSTLALFSDDALKEALTAVRNSNIQKYDKVRRKNLPEEKETISREELIAKILQNISDFQALNEEQKKLNGLAQFNDITTPDLNN